MGNSDTTPRASAFDGVYVKVVVAVAILFLAFELTYFTLSGRLSFAEPSLDFLGDVVGRDFLLTWMGGRSILGYGPAAWIDPSVYNAALRVMLGPGLPEHFWSDPPHLALFTWPSGLLPYLPAYIVWCTLGLALYVLASTAFVRREHLLFAAVAPGVAVCIFFGQSGLYTAALLLGGFALLQRQQIAAGILFGILTVRPQLAILVPIMLLLTGRWLAVLSMLVTSSALAAAAGYLFGWQVWTAFIDKAIPHLQWLLEHGGGLSYLTISSVFSGSRLAGLSVEIAWLLQGLASILVVAAVVWTYWRKRDPMLSMALFVTATFLVTPYVLNYDMVIFGGIVAMLRRRDDNAVLDHWLGLAVWSLPVTMMLFGTVFVPLGPLLLLAFAGRLLWRLSHRADEERKTAHMPPSQGQPAEVSASGEESPPVPA